MMDIYDMRPAEAVRVTRDRYYHNLQQLHTLVKEGVSPPVYLMQALEQARQLAEMAEEHLAREEARVWGGARELTA